MSNISDTVIQGNPTKTFFIEMITRDISIKDAILDLLDNSIDGANRINPESYQGLFIEIIISKDEFIVKDNCGGFSLDTAKKYAFRFGRPDDAPKTEGSVGRFGVGMKRALFKMGQNFEVESKTDTDHFQIDIDVNLWKQKKQKIRKEDDVIIEVDDWNFNYTYVDEDSSNIEENGTYVRVNNLHKEVSDFFEEESFISELKLEIEKLLNFSIEKGINITLNGISLEKKGIVLFNDRSNPYFYETTFGNVKVRIIAGLSFVGDPSSSGWYIYCNDRLVVEADKSDITVWGKKSIPKFHTDYVMFKGVVFLDADDTLDLPLTTTKKGIDTSAEVYKKTLTYMIEATNDVLSFLKRVRNIDDANEYRKLLGEQEDKISVKDLKTYNFSTERTFVSPVLDADQISEKDQSITVSFKAPKEKVAYAKEYSGKSTNSDFGKYIFDYYLKMEEIDE